MIKSSSRWSRKYIFLFFSFFSLYFVFLFLHDSLSIFYAMAMHVSIQLRDCITNSNARIYVHIACSFLREAFLNAKRSICCSELYQDVHVLDYFRFYYFFFFFPKWLERFTSSLLLFIFSMIFYPPFFRIVFGKNLRRYTKQIYEIFYSYKWTLLRKQSWLRTLCDNDLSSKFIMELMRNVRRNVVS